MKQVASSLFLAALLSLMTSVSLAEEEPDHAEEPEGSHEHDVTELDVLVVESTRSRRRIEDAPIRVEALGREEIEEKLLMRPGNISMLLAESGGLRVQVTSPALGSSNIRVHGMRGRYTQLLADGLPLYGGQASSLGLLQIPPSDLGQVEVIKGSASALYGGQALGGVINLISKRPQQERTGELIINGTTRNGQDLAAYGSTPITEAWSGSLLGTFNRQSAKDLDDDGWIDMAEFDRWSTRSRLFHASADGSKAFLTLGAMGEARRGGTSPGSVAPDGQPFPQEQETERVDAGLVIDKLLPGFGTATVRASGMQQAHGHRFGDVLEPDLHRTMMAEASLSGYAMGSTLVGGLAFQLDDYTSDAFPQFNYSYEVPAVFGQIERDLSDQVFGVVSARWDAHDEYGDELSPRVSLLYKPGAWSLRGSWGRGFYAPTPFVEETEAAGLSRLEPLGDLRAETAETASLDLGYAAGAFESGLTLFRSTINDAVRLQPVAPDRVRLINVDGDTRNEGVEALARVKRGFYSLTASYLYVSATEPDGAGGRRPVPLTPRHSAGLVGMWEQHDHGRVGLEVYYTGPQSLEDNPYRTTGKSYFEMGLLGEIVLGRCRIFLNLENLLNVRQTREDPLLRPARAPDGSWTVDAWAPVEGFVANAGVRFLLGGDHH